MSSLSCAKPLRPVIAAAACRPCPAAIGRGQRFQSSFNCSSVYLRLASSTRSRSGRRRRGGGRGAREVRRSRSWSQGTARTRARIAQAPLRRRRPPDLRGDGRHDAFVILRPDAIAQTLELRGYVAPETRPGLSKVVGGDAAQECDMLCRGLPSTRTLSTRMALMRARLSRLLGARHGFERL